MKDYQDFTRYHSIHSLIKGTAVPLLGIGACVSIQFSAIEAMKRYYKSKKSDPSQLLTSSELFVSGAVSGIANTIVATPVEHIRIRLQVQSAGDKLYNGPIHCIKTIYKNHGIAGLYKGQAITTLRESLGFGFYFLAYEYLVQDSIKRNGFKSRADLPTWQVITFGAAAGYALWIPLFPVDVIKSKIQTDGFSGPSRKYAGSLDCLRHIIRQNGISGLYKGFTPCLLRAAPVNAATFVAFEAAMKLLG
jgi:solute carrier family 25 carnitine/acylcarnitine transporter 20/29